MKEKEKADFFKDLLNSDDRDYFEITLESLYKKAIK
jgi:hypothetical protein